MKQKKRINIVHLFQNITPTRATGKAQGQGKFVAENLIAWAAG